MSFLDTLTSSATHWHWWILGMVLLGIEIFVPGFFFLWMGIAGLVVGFILFSDPSLPWQWQVILFALLSVAAIAAWRFWMRGSLTPPTDQPTLNRRADQYVGRVFTLEQPIVNGRGRIRLEDTSWTVEGSDLPTGATVRVTATVGVVLRVEPAHSP